MNYEYAKCIQVRQSSFKNVNSVDGNVQYNLFAKNTVETVSKQYIPRRFIININDIRRTYIRLTKHSI